ncbi:MAG: chemotaxis protein [Desulfobacterium sp.]|nr:chemotaxis protein [Desulfobacterium sp.]
MHISKQEFSLIRDYIEAKSGIFLGNEKMYLIENRLSDMITRAGCSNFSEFYFKIKNDPSSSNLTLMMMDAITTNETSWFRDPKTFLVLKEVILPELCDKINIGGPDKINIWSAACSTGQEPYSISITALEFFHTKGGEKMCQKHIHIFATDISASTIAAATEAQYDSAAMKRGLPLNYMERYFQNIAPNRWLVRDNIRTMITFKQHNLKVPLIENLPFHVIFLRNVIIYFSENFKQQLFRQIAKRMAPDGYLLLGTGEILNSDFNAFDTVTYQGYSYYRLKKANKH